MVTVTCTSPTVFAQRLSLPPSTSLPALPSESVIEQAVAKDVAGEPADLFSLKEQFGDRLLPSFAERRFDKNYLVRRAALRMTSDSYESLLFRLPMIDDADERIAFAAMRGIITLSRPQEQLRRLNALEVVPKIVAALARFPDLRKDERTLLVLSVFKDDPAARRLLGYLLKENRWNNFFVGNTPVKWDEKTVAALMVQCEMGRFGADQVQRALDADPQAKRFLLNYVNLMTNKSLLRYTLSFLYDTTSEPGPYDDVGGYEIGSQARSMLFMATKIEISYTRVDGVPVYNKEDIARLCAFYGLTEK